MIIDGKQIKEKYLDKIKEEITSKKITLAVIQVGNDEASSVYVKQKEEMCAQIGANFNHYTFDETTSEEEIINKSRNIAKNMLKQKLKMVDDEYKNYELLVAAIDRADKVNKSEV